MALEKYLTVSTYFCRTDFANESKQSKTCVYAFLTGILGWGAKDKPLLSSCNSSRERVKLLRLCTIKEVSGFLGGLRIKMTLFRVFRGSRSWCWAFPLLSYLLLWSSTGCRGLAFFL